MSKRERQTREAGLVRLRAIEEAAGAEEPGAAADDRTAERELVGRNRVIDLRLVERAGGPPVVVRERRAERAAEAVAARAGDGIDDAAGEAAVLGGDAGRRDRGFLDGVLDEERERRAAEVVLDLDAIEHEQVVGGHRATDGDGIVRARRVRRGREVDRRQQRARRGQRRQQFLLNVGRRLDGVGEGVGACRDGHDFAERGLAQRDLDLYRLPGADVARDLRGGKAAELDSDGVGARRQAWKDVVAVGRGNGQTDALKIRRDDGDRGAGHFESARVTDSPPDRSGRSLRIESGRSRECRCDSQHRGDKRAPRPHREEPGHSTLSFLVAADRRVRESMNGKGGAGFLPKRHAEADRTGHGLLSARHRCATSRPRWPPTRR